MPTEGDAIPPHEHNTVSVPDLFTVISDSRPAFPFSLPDYHLATLRPWVTACLTVTLPLSSEPNLSRPKCDAWAEP